MVNEQPKKAGDKDTVLQPAGEDNETMRSQKVRRLLTKFSAILFIGLPTLIAIVYFTMIASDQYATEVRFAVRGVSSSGGSELLGFVTGIPSSGSTTSDSYILMDYLHSRTLLEELQKKLDLKQIYGRGQADFLSSFDMEKPIEEFIKYWRKMTAISYDTSSQIIVMEVRAFTPNDAKKIADAILQLSEKLVNELSAKARSDAVSHAKVEVARMEKKLRSSRRAVRAFREKEQIIDPSKTAESRLTLLAEFEGKLSAEKAKLNSLRQFMDKKSPRIQFLVSKIKALEKQVRNERGKMGKRSGNKTRVSGDLTGLLEHYRDLLMNQEFAEKAYLSTLTSLETAQLDASRRQRYLAIFVKPSLPEMALYPKRLLNIFLTFVIATIVWLIGTLIAYSIRDHIT